MNFIKNTIKSIKNKLNKIDKYLESIDNKNKDYYMYWYSNPTDTSMIPIYIKLDKPKKRKYNKRK